ncbi:hypothetical protein GCM10010307_17140 [Streptomyces vastus]|uniref:Secreted protein n=1 Tax=Streptomyces vastus TaxID=285451 RepID=A0ABN3QJM8_9ACTN
MKGTNWVLVPPLVVTVTFTVPVPEGVRAVILVVLLVNAGDDLDPNRTLVTPVNPVPVTVTVVPPEAGPWLGLTEETTGGGMAVLLHAGLGDRRRARPRQWRDCEMA